MVRSPGNLATSRRATSWTVEISGSTLELRIFLRSSTLFSVFPTGTLPPPTIGNSRTSLSDGVETDGTPAGSVKSSVSGPIQIVLSKLGS